MLNKHNVLHKSLYTLHKNADFTGFRSCFRKQGAPHDENFCSADKAIFRSNPDGLQGKATQYAGKKTVQTVCNAYENGFSSLAVVENFVFPDEHQHGNAECTGLGHRNGQPDALDAQHEGQEDEGQQLEQQGAQERDERTGHAIAQGREEGGRIDVEPVSYTHLTLPTNSRV